MTRKVCHPLVQALQPSALHGGGGGVRGENQKLLSRGLLYTDEEADDCDDSVMMMKKED